MQAQSLTGLFWCKVTAFNKVNSRGGCFSGVKCFLCQGSPEKILKYQVRKAHAFLHNKGLYKGCYP
jgi:hypothetical protein